MTTDLNWIRVQNGWHVSANRKYHAVRYTVGGVHGAQVRWRLTLSARTNPKTLADEPTLHAVKAKALAYQQSLEQMPIGGWTKSHTDTSEGER